MRKNIQYTLYIFLGIFIIMFFCCCCKKNETFANKNKRTFLDVDGNILGFDMIDHHDTFDYEKVVTEHQHLDMYM
jgi:Na+-translocating ferredoxin:NAD+ oxidoreductase RnfE subunit